MLIILMQIQLRDYRPADIDVILKLFKETVRTINARHYTRGQVEAWAPDVEDTERWQQTLSQNYTVVAEQEGIILGFADIEHNGYLNRLFVHKDYQGKGVATLLTDALEEYIFTQGIKTIMVTASITARPFFEGRGYMTIDEVSSESEGQVLKNFLMQKRYDH